MAITELRWRLRWPRSVQKVHNDSRCGVRGVSYPTFYDDLVRVAEGVREIQKRKDEKRISVTVLNRASGHLVVF